jgi:hypothetical protein
MPAPASPNRDIKNTFAAYIISYNKTVHNQINSLDHFLVTAQNQQIMMQKSSSHLISVSKVQQRQFTVASCHGSSIQGIKCFSKSIARRTGSHSISRPETQSKPFAKVILSRNCVRSCCGDAAWHFEM